MTKSLYEGKTIVKITELSSGYLLMIFDDNTFCVMKPAITPGELEAADLPFNYDETEVPSGENTEPVDEGKEAEDKFGEPEEEEPKKKKKKKKKKK